MISRRTKIPRLSRWSVEINLLGFTENLLEDTEGCGSLRPSIFLCMLTCAILMTSSQSKDQDTLGLQGELVWEACAATGAGSDPASLLGLPPSSKQEFFQPRRAGLAPSGPPVPPCQHIWLKKLSDGYAVAFVNYTFINATDGAAAAQGGC